MVVPDRLQPYLRSSVDNFDWAGLPHIQTLAITGPFDATGPGDTPSRRRIFICHRGHSRLRETDPRNARAPGLSPAGLGRRPANPDELLRIRPPTEWRFRSRHRERAAAHSRQSEIRFPRGARPRRRQDVRPSHQRYRTGFAAFVFPLEQHPGRRTVERRESKAR